MTGVKGKYYGVLKKYLHRPKFCASVGMFSSKRDWLTKQKGKKMTENTIAERVKKIIVDHLGVDVAKVQDNASFIDDLGADSLDTVELVMAFEEEFGCSIPDDAAEKIRTVKDAIDFIEKQQA